MSRMRTTFQNVEVYYFYATAIYLFLKNIMKNSLPFEAQRWAEFRTLSRMSMYIIFMKPAYINFPKYYGKTFTVGSVIMSRIQSTFQNVEVYYFYAADIYQFSKILWNILYQWRRHVKENSENFSEDRRVLFYAAAIY